MPLDSRREKLANLILGQQSSTAERLIAAIDKLTEVLQRLEAKEYPSFYRTHIHHPDLNKLQRLKAKRVK